MQHDPVAAADPRRNEGGEWHLLVERLSLLLSSVEPARLWAQLQPPLLVAAWLLAAVVVLKVYVALLAAIASVPTLSGWLELVGLVWALRFTAGHLLKRSERDQTLAAWQTRWRGIWQRG